MLRITFIGHQGWLVSSGRTTVLVDPLLGEGFGHGGQAGRVYPPRTLELAKFPAIDAVVVSHEHDDHFDLPSLARLSRETPIYLSSRSSVAAFEIVQQMGFSVQALHSGQELAVGDLRYRAFTADHTGRRGADEWDVFPFVLYDTAGSGSLMSSVDVRPGERMLETLGTAVPRAGVWAYANNSTSAAFQLVGAGYSTDGDAEALERVAVRRYLEVERAWGTPAATLVCGAGWSYEGERAWLNHQVFPVSGQRLCEAMRRERPQGRFAAPAPGYTVKMDRGRVVEQQPRCGFIRALPQERWPSREPAGDGARLGDYAPACGRRRLARGELEALLEELQDLARYLYGTRTFEQLHSLPSAAAEGPRPALILALRDEGDRGTLVLRHEPRRCAFVEEPVAEPMQAFMSGLECWASDLLALLRGELGPTALCYSGRLRVWNHDPRRLRISAHELWMFAHPLRRPEAARRLYRRLLAATPSTCARVPGPAAAK